MIVYTSISMLAGLAFGQSGDRVGRWRGDCLSKAVPSGKLPSAPLLGNGYAGVVLGTQGHAPGLHALDLWLK